MVTPTGKLNAIGGEFSKAGGEMSPVRGMDLAKGLKPSDYSTVTDLAKFRGWSTSRSSKRAM